MPDNPGEHSREYISLRDYFESRMMGIEKAIELAYRQMERRLEGMNEFRESLKDQSRTFVTRAEFEVFKERIDEDVRFLREARALLEGKASQSSMDAVRLISVIGLLIAMASLVLAILRL